MADQKWKLGGEFLPYHRSASHIDPAYRDGWNACYYNAAERVAAALEALEDNDPHAATVILKNALGVKPTEPQQEK